MQCMMLSYSMNLGHILIIACAIINLLNVVRFDARLPIAQLFCSVCAFGLLIYFHIFDHFEIVNVATTSHQDMSMLYKICGIWGNHEGSMLLWAFVLSCYNIMTRNNDIASRIHSSITSCIYLYIYILSDPFAKSTVNIGSGLNPILQDIAISIHPPILYIGYIGSSIVYSIVLSGIIRKTTNQEWLQEIRKWLIFSWSFMTLGIGLGSWWAYRELGWGGIWFWDPVENISLMPWLMYIIAIHSLKLPKASTRIYTPILCMISFLIVMLGTFMVRSGAITSVHSFTSDPYRGMLLLILTCIYTLYGLYICMRSPTSQEDKIAMSYKSLLLVSQQTLCLVVFITIFIGTIYPIVSFILLKKPIVIGAMYYNSVLSYFFIPLLVLMSLTLNVNRIWISLLIIIVAILMLKCDFILRITIGASIFLIISAIWDIANFSNISFKHIWLLSHLGFGTFALGISLVSGYSQEITKSMNIGTSLEIGNLRIKVANASVLNMKNYKSLRVQINVMHRDQYLHSIYPEIRKYSIENINMPEAAIYHNLFSDVYVIISDIDRSHNSIVLRAQYKPGINCIWIGCITMSFPLLFSFLRRGINS